MIDITEFSNVFPRAAKQLYPMNLADQVTNATKTLGEQLFFHLLLDTVQIQASHLYPPRNVKDLQELHRHIVDTDTCREAVKQSLLFYLLKDCDANYATSHGRSTTAGSQKSSQGDSQQRRGRRRNNEDTASREDANESDSGGDWAGAFAEKAHMPRVYALCMEGFWRLDRLDFKEAIAYLTHPSLIPQFTHQVLYALLNAQQTSLSLAYFNAWHLSIEEGPANLKNLFLTARAKASLTDSFFFWRGGMVFESPEERKALLRVIVDSALDTNEAEEERKMQELVDLPLKTDEEVLFTEIMAEEEAHAGNLKRKDRKRRVDEVIVLRDLAKFRYKDAASRIQSMGLEGGMGEKWQVILGRLRDESRV